MYKGFEFIVNPQTVTATKTITITFISISTGAYKSVQLTVEKNDQVTPATNNPQAG